MNDIVNIYDLEIQRLLKKYNIKKYNLEDNTILVQINQIFNKKLIDKRNIAIWGVGEHTEKLLDKTNLKDMNIKYLVDRNIDEKVGTINGFKLIKNTSVREYNIDCIVISSFAYRREILEDIKKIYTKKNIEVIDIYNELENQGFKCNNVFYVNEIERIGFKDYKELNSLKNLYEKEKNSNEKQKILKGLIFKYIEIRDFIYAFKYTDEYINNKYCKYEDMIFLKKELNGLFNRLKNNLKENNSKNVWIFFIDSIKYKSINETKFLKKFAKENTSFEYAYSNSLYTYESFLSALDGKMPFDKEYNKIKLIDENDIDFIRVAKSENYNNVYSLYRDDPMLKVSERVFDGGKHVSKDIWNSITNTNNNKKNMVFTYSQSEGHTPFLCGYHKGIVNTLGKIISFEERDKNDLMKKQFVEGLKYLDKQMEFYLDIVPSKDDVLIFSDHGNMGEYYNNSIENINDKFAWHEDRIRIPVLVKSNSVIKGKINQFLQLNQIGELISCMLKGENFKSDRKFAHIQMSRINNFAWRQVFSNNKMERYLNGFEILLDKENKFVNCTGGEQYLYKFDGYEEKLIDNECEVDNVRNKYKKYFYINV